MDWFWPSPHLSFRRGLNPVKILDPVRKWRHLYNTNRPPSPADSLAWERGHVGHVSQPSDRPGGRHRSSFSFLFYKKTLDFSRNKTRRPSLSLGEIFKKNPQILPKPTRSPLPPSQQYFPKDPLHFLKINPPSFLSQELSLKDPRILLKLCNNLFQSFLLQ